MTRKDIHDHSDRLLTLKEAAERLGLSSWTLRRWCLQARIESVKLGGRRLIPESTIARMIEKSTQRADCCTELRLD